MISSYLVFQLAGRLFGARLSGAIEILPWRRARPVPLAYSYVEGLIDYRGVIYPLFNVSQRLGLGKAGPIGFTAEAPEPGKAGQSIILLEENKVPFGIIVDSVAKMARFEEPAGVSAAAGGIDKQFLRGIVHDDDQEIMILDFERLLHAS
jgi:purine-binding chemotaxis protein CheW